MDVGYWEVCVVVFGGEWSEGGIKSTSWIEWMDTNLTEEQKFILVEIAVDELGYSCTREEFVEVLFSLLENVSGFECVSDKEVECLIDELWSKYCGITT